jgi:hypothetical protein
VLAIFYITITLLSGHTIGLGFPEAPLNPDRFIDHVSEGLGALSLAVP